MLTESPLKLDKIGDLWIGLKSQVKPRFLMSEIQPNSSEEESLAQGTTNLIQAMQLLAQDAVILEAIGDIENVEDVSQFFTICSDFETSGLVVLDIGVEAMQEIININLIPSLTSNYISAQNTDLIIDILSGQSPVNIEFATALIRGSIVSGIDLI